MFVEVYAEDEVSAYYAFQKRLITNKVALNALCHRTLELFENPVVLESFELPNNVKVNTVIRSWFKSLFLNVFGENQILSFWDKYFCVPEGKNSKSVVSDNFYLCFFQAQSRISFSAVQLWL